MLCKLQEVETDALGDKETLISICRCGTLFQLVHALAPMI